MEAINFVVAAAAVEARPAGALVHVRLAAFAAEAQSAHTLKAVHQVLDERHMMTELLLRK